MIPHFFNSQVLNAIFILAVILGAIIFLVALISLIQLVISDREYRKELARKNYEKSEKYLWNICCSTFTQGRPPADCHDFHEAFCDGPSIWIYEHTATDVDPKSRCLFMIHIDELSNQMWCGNSPEIMTKLWEGKAPLGDLKKTLLSHLDKNEVFCWRRQSLVD